MESRCLKCGRALFRQALLDDNGHKAMVDDTPINSDGVDKFYSCPHCGARNVTVEGRSPHVLWQRRISHVK